MSRLNKTIITLKNVKQLILIWKNKEKINGLHLSLLSTFWSSSALKICKCPVHLSLKLPVCLSVTQASCLSVSEDDSEADPTPQLVQSRSGLIQSWLAVSRLAVLVSS